MNDATQFSMTYTNNNPEAVTADDVRVSITDHQAGPMHFEKSIMQIWDFTHWAHVTNNNVPAHRQATSHYYPQELRDFVIKYCNQSADVQQPPIPPQYNPPTQYADLWKADIEEFDEHLHGAPRHF